MAKKEEKNGKRTTIGIAGAVIGATVAVAAAKMLSDKKTRKAVLNKLHDVKDQVMDSMGTIKEEVINLDDKVIETLSKEKTTTKKRTKKKNLHE